MVLNGQSVILHIGYPKSASSFLKRDFFAAAEENFIIPRGSQLNTLFADASGERIRKSVLMDAVSRKHPIVVSNEILAGRSFWSAEGARDVCRNWKNAFPESKVVVMIRRQREYILSAYKYSVYTGHYLPPLSEFWERSREVVLEKICYDSIIDDYQKSFGAENVCVLPVELLKHSEDQFYTVLEGFTGMKRANAREASVPNVSPSSWRYINFLRRVNLFLGCLASAERALRRLWETNRISNQSHRIVLYRSIVDPLAAFFASDSYVSEVFDSEDMTKIAKSNRRTSELIGVDLKEFGYIS